MKYFLKYFLISFLLFPVLCQAEQITSARGIVTINDGDTYKGNSFWTGTIENLDNVTFIKTNFSRKIPHTDVFVNCTNLIFIDCNLVNVELQADFKTQDSLTIHRREYGNLGINYIEVECGDNKTRTYRIDAETIDTVERDFKTLSVADKDKIKQKYMDDGINYTEDNIEEVLISKMETPDAKKIKAIRIDR